MSLGCDFALSLILGLRNVHAVLCHLFRCFHPRFKENIHCHPTFIVRDINSCRKTPEKAVRNPGRVITLTYRLLLNFITKYSAIAHCRMKSYLTKFKSFLWKIVQMGTLQKLQIPYKPL